MSNYQGKVGITGGAGFLGSHITDYFVEKGINTVVIDNFSSGKRKNINHHEGKKNFEVRMVNLVDEKSTTDSISDLDLVIHLAARIGGIGYFHKIPADIIADNDLINRNVFNACLWADVNRMIYFSSSMVFERAETFPSKEKDLSETPPPKSAYGFQKLNGEYYCKAYKKQYDLNYTILRPFNAVGPREYPAEEVGHAHVIPDFCYKIITEKQYPLEILGNGKQIRAFTNVKDLARGCFKATFSKEAVNEDFNLGNPEDIKIKGLAKKIWNLAERERNIEFEYGDSFSEDVQKRIPSVEKAKKILGWKPKIPLEQSLEEYISWYCKVMGEKND